MSKNELKTKRDEKRENIIHNIASKRIYLKDT